MRRQSLIIGILMTTFLVGCTNKEPDTVEIKSIDERTLNETEYEAHMERELEEHLIIDADIRGPKYNEYAIYKAVLGEYTSENIVDNILGGDSSLMENGRFEDEKFYGDYRIHNSVKYVNIMDIKSGDNIVYQCYDTIWNTISNRNGNSLYNYTTDMTGINVVDELPELGKEDAINMVRDAAESVGVQMSEEPILCAGFDYKLIEDIVSNESGIYTNKYAYEYMYDACKEYTFTENNWFYLVAFEQMIEGDVLLSDNYASSYVGGGDNLFGGGIRAIIDENGIGSLYIGKPYVCDYEDAEYANIIDIDKAIDIYKKQYSNIALSYDITTMDISFEYVPKYADDTYSNFFIVPSWVFTSYYIDEEGGREYILTKINAIDGEIVYFK